jgi:hypothetical protein
MRTPFASPPADVLSPGYPTDPIAEDTKLCLIGKIDVTFGHLMCLRPGEQVIDEVRLSECDCGVEPTEVTSGLNTDCQTQTVMCH